MRIKQRLIDTMLVCIPMNERNLSWNGQGFDPQPDEKLAKAGCRFSLGIVFKSRVALNHKQNDGKPPFPRQRKG